MANISIELRNDRYSVTGGIKSGTKTFDVGTVLLNYKADKQL